MIDVVINGAGDAWSWQWVFTDSGGEHLLATSEESYLSAHAAEIAGKVALIHAGTYDVVDLTEV